MSTAALFCFGDVLSSFDGDLTAMIFKSDHGSIGRKDDKPRGRGQSWLCPFLLQHPYIVAVGDRHSVVNSADMSEILNKAILVHPVFQG